MKIATISLAVVALLSSGLLASDSGVFIGLEGALGKAKLDAKASAGGANVSIGESVNSQSVGLNVGYRFNPDHRVYVGYRHFTGDLADGDARSYLVGYDFTPKISGNFRGLVGLYGGFTEILDGRDATGGLKLGGIYDVNANNEIQFGVKYDYTELDMDYGNTVSEGKLELKNTAFYIGYNYKF